jgi:hypothetical protein
MFLKQEIQEIRIKNINNRKRLVPAFEKEARLAMVLKNYKQK